MPRPRKPKCDVESVYQRLKTESDGREYRYKRALGHYRAWAPDGLRPWEFTPESGRGGGLLDDAFDRNHYKVIWSIVQTILSRVVAQRQAPKVITNNAKESLQTQAKLLDSLILGIMKHEGFYSHLYYQVRDCLLFGFGALKFFLSGCGKRVKVKQVRPWDLFFTASKRAVFERMFVDRADLMKLYPRHSADIENASRVFAGEGDDLIEVIDYYKTGVEHVVHLAGEEKPLLVEDWEEEHPYTILYSEEDFCGPYPPAFVDQLIPVQEELDFVTSRIQKYFDQFGTTYIIARQDSGIPMKHLSAQKDACVITYETEPPRLFTGPAVSSEAWKYEDHLNGRLHQISGVSQLAAQGVKPAGIESGIALRTLNDIENQKFSILSRNVQDCVVKAGEQIIRCAKRGDVSVKHAGSLRFTEIRWSQIKMDSQDYILQVAAASHLPQEPSAKLQQIQEMLQGGMIQVSEARELLEMPDLEAYETLSNATHNAVKEDLEEMISSGKFQSPSKYVHIGAAKGLAVRYRALHRRDKKARELLERYIDELILLEIRVGQDSDVVKQIAGKGPLAPPQMTFQNRSQQNVSGQPGPAGPQPVAGAPAPGPAPGAGPGPEFPPVRPEGGGGPIQ